jgi:ketosteroid isomerase-like protein
MEIVDDWVKIWNTYDLSRVRELFLNDGRVTYFSSEKEGLIMGIEALVKHHIEFGFVEGGKDQPNSLWLEDIEIEQFGDIAVVKADWIFKRGNSDQLQRGPVTLVYVNEGEGYKIGHAHFSNY